MTLARRLWWATLPYYGWTGYCDGDYECGAIPPPWYAHPLSWLHRVVDFSFFRNRDVFGPRHNDTRLRASVEVRPWQ